LNEILFTGTNVVVNKEIKVQKFTFEWVSKKFKTKARSFQESVEFPTRDGQYGAEQHADLYEVSFHPLKQCLRFGAWVHRVHNVNPQRVQTSLLIEKH
jgi:hypothetical protein